MSRNTIHVGTLETSDKIVHLHYRHLTDPPDKINYESLRSVLDWWNTGTGPNGEAIEPAKLENLYEYLKEHATKIHYFGLGFVQVKLRKDERYHFYSPELAAITPPEEIHDHRYGFVSTVIKGTLEQEFYTVKPATEGGYQLRQVSCDPDKPAPAEVEMVWPVKTFKNIQVERSSYEIEPDTLHKVLPVKTNTITYLHRKAKTKNFARVVSKNSEHVCPFSTPMTEDECWAHVKKIIEEK